MRPTIDPHLDRVPGVNYSNNNAINNISPKVRSRLFWATSRWNIASAKTYRSNSDIAATFNSNSVQLLMLQSSERIEIAFLLPFPIVSLDRGEDSHARPIGRQTIGKTRLEKYIALARRC